MEEFLGDICRRTASEAHVLGSQMSSTWTGVPSVRYMVLCVCYLANYGLNVYNQLSYRVAFATACITQGVALLHWKNIRIRNTSGIVRVRFDRGAVLSTTRWFVDGARKPGVRLCPRQLSELCEYTTKQVVNDPIVPC